MLSLELVYVSKCSNREWLTWGSSFFCPISLWRWMMMPMLHIAAAHQMTKKAACASQLFIKSYYPWNSRSFSFIFYLCFDFWNLFVEAAKRWKCLTKSDDGVDVKDGDAAQAECFECDRRLHYVLPEAGLVHLRHALRNNESIWWIDTAIGRVRAHTMLRMILAGRCSIRAISHTSFCGSHTPIE